MAPPRWRAWRRGCSEGCADRSPGRRSRCARAPPRGPSRRRSACRSLPEHGDEEQEAHEHRVGQDEGRNAGRVSHADHDAPPARAIPVGIEGTPVPMESPYHIILFDIDGTLVSTGGAGAVAWRRAFEDLHGIPADIGAYTDAGMTDPDVGAKTFAAVLGRDPTPHELALLVQRR